MLGTSLSNAAERERKALEFDQKRRWANRVSQSRISSWADPVSARDILDGEDEEVGVGAKRKKEMKPSRLAEGSVVEEDEDEGELVGDWSDGEREAPRRMLVYDAQRCGCSHRSGELCFSVHLCQATQLSRPFVLTRHACAERRANEGRRRVVWAVVDYDTEGGAFAERHGLLAGICYLL
jgi:hypothetical protein